MASGLVVFGIVNGAVGRWRWFDGVRVVGWSEMVVGGEGVEVGA